MFNPIAGRPYPTNHISLEQSIRCEDTAVFTNFTTSVAVGTYAGYYFALASFGAVTAYTAFFDQYRIEQCELWFEPQDVAASGQLFANLATCVDLDDANTPATYATVADHQGAMVGGGGAGRYHKWVPHMAVATYSGTFTSYANEPAGWIDCSSPNVQHFGLKVASFPTPAAAQVYTVNVRAVFSFRAPGIL